MNFKCPLAISYMPNPKLKVTNKAVKDIAPTFEADQAASNVARTITGEAVHMFRKLDTAMALQLGVAFQLLLERCVRQSPHSAVARLDVRFGSSLCGNGSFWAGKFGMVTPCLAQARIAFVKPPTPRMLITLFIL
jgi:hypothetical protein